MENKSDKQEKNGLDDGKRALNSIGCNTKQCFYEAFSVILKYINDQISHPDTFCKKAEKPYKTNDCCTFSSLRKLMFCRFLCLKNGKRQTKRDEEIKKREKLEKPKIIETNM